MRSLARSLSVARFEHLLRMASTRECVRLVRVCTGSTCAVNRNTHTTSSVDTHIVHSPQLAAWSSACLLAELEALNAGIVHHCSHMHVLCLCVCVYVCAVHASAQYRQRHEQRSVSAQQQQQQQHSSSVVTRVMVIAIVAHRIDIVGVVGSAVGLNVGASVKPSV